jgi:hypothetical protein
MCVIVETKIIHASRLNPQYVQVKKLAIQNQLKKAKRHAPSVITQPSARYFNEEALCKF